MAGDGLDFFADDLVPSTVPAPAQDGLDVTDFGSASLAAFDAPVSSDALAGADASFDPLVDPVVPPTSESEGFVLDSFTTTVAEEVNIPSFHHQRLEAVGCGAGSDTSIASQCFGSSSSNPNSLSACFVTFSQSSRRPMR